MRKTLFFRVVLGFSILFLLLAFSILFFGNKAGSGPFFILFLCLLAVGVRGFAAFRSFSFTIWIFMAVTASMYYPQYFTSLGDFQYKVLIIPLLQVIMFGMGSQMSLQDFTGVLSMPKGVIIGVCSHYLIMPLVAFSIAHLFSFPPEIAAGIILIGSVPSGLASNVMSYIARANLALAVTIGAISTLLSPLVTPFLMKTLGGQYIEVNFWKMMLDILNMIILPIVAGFIFNLFNARIGSRKNRIVQLSVFFVIILLTNLVYVKSMQADVAEASNGLLKSLAWFYFLPILGALLVRRVLGGDKKHLEKILSFLSMAGIAFIITIITASGRDSLLEVGLLLILTSLLHNLAGYSLGYGISWLFGMPEKDRRTIAFEVGMQNGGLASGLALQMGKMATVGLAPAVFGPLMNVTGSALASWWRNRGTHQGNPQEQKEGDGS